MSSRFPDWKGRPSWSQSVRGCQGSQQAFGGVTQSENMHVLDCSGTVSQVLCISDEKDKSADAQNIELNIWAFIVSPCVINVNRRGKSKEKKSCWHVLAALLNVLQWAIPVGS